jgi:tryptophan halogenase
VFLGHGIVPRSYDPLVTIKSDPQIEQFLGNIAATIQRCIDVMPEHTGYIAKYCPAEPIA